MKTKEEILKEEYSKLIVNPDKVYAQNPSIIEAAHTSMDVFAKQQAIAFLKYKEDGGYIFEHSRQEYMKLGAAHINAPRLPREALYDQFIESTNK